MTQPIETAGASHPTTDEQSSPSHADMPVKQQRVKRAAENLNAKPHPSAEEAEEHVIHRNGIELCLQRGEQDPNITMAKDLHLKFPGHLVLIQAGEFLHAYDKCAYFLHRLKNYRMKLMGSGSTAYLRVGFPLKNSKRRIWKIMADFKVPYLVLLGSHSAGYKSYSSERDFDQQSLLLEITDHLVEGTIAELQQTDRLQHVATAKLLLRKDVTFRLKVVAQELYGHLIRDVADYPRNHRHGLGKDIHEIASTFLRLVYAYPFSQDRVSLLRKLSGAIDLLKYLITQAFELKLLDDGKLNHRVALSVELGNLTGGLLAKPAAQPKAAAI